VVHVASGAVSRVAHCGATTFVYCSEPHLLGLKPASRAGNTQRKPEREPHRSKRWLFRSYNEGVFKHVRAALGISDQNYFDALEKVRAPRL